MEPIQRQPLARWNQNRDCWEEPQEDIFGHSGVWSETWPPSGMTRNGLVFELPMLGHHTADIGSSYLPSPRASDGMGGNDPLSRPEHMDDLGTRIERILLPTPAAMNLNDGESVETWEARRARVKVTANNGNGFGTPLAVLNGATMPPRSTEPNKP